MTEAIANFFFLSLFSENVHKLCSPLILKYHVYQMPSKRANFSKSKQKGFLFGCVTFSLAFDMR